MGKPNTTHAATTTVIAALLLALLPGCGSSNTTTTNTKTNPPSTQPTANTTTPTPTTATTTTPTTTTAAQTKQKKPEETAPVVEKVEITSPVMHYEGPIPTQYTCKGKNTSPPLHWKGIPPGTKELLLEILNFKPVKGALYYDWSIAGINPASHGTPAAGLPPGAIQGTNTTHQTKYSLCPQHPNTPETYVTVLFALPHTLHPKPGFNPNTLRKQALKTAKYEGFLLFHTTPR